MKLEYTNPPDLMNRFVETPYRCSIIHRGLSIEIMCNREIDLSTISKDSTETTDSKLRWTIIFDDTPAVSRETRIAHLGPVSTILSSTGALTFVDHQSCEAFTFAPSCNAISETLVESLESLLTSDSVS